MILHTCLCSFFLFFSLLFFLSSLLVLPLPPSILSPSPSLPLLSCSPSSFCLFLTSSVTAHPCHLLVCSACLHLSHPLLFPSLNVSLGLHFSLFLYHILTSNHSSLSLCWFKILPPNRLLNWLAENYALWFYSYPHKTQTLFFIACLFFFVKLYNLHFNSEDFCFACLQIQATPISNQVNTMTTGQSLIHGSTPLSQIGVVGTPTIAGSVATSSGSSTPCTGMLHFFSIFYLYTCFSFYSSYFISKPLRI